MKLGLSMWFIIPVIIALLGSFLTPVFGDVPWLLIGSVIFGLLLGVMTIQPKESLKFMVSIVLIVVTLTGSAILAFFELIPVIGGFIILFAGHWVAIYIVAGLLIAFRNVVGSSKS